MVQVPCLQHQATDQAQQLFLAPEAQRAGLKHAVQQLSILQKVQSTLEESEAMASINPAKKIGQQYIMYNLDIDNGLSHQSISCTSSLPRLYCQS